MKTKFVFECESYFLSAYGKKIGGNIKFVAKCPIGGIICDVAPQKVCLLLDADKSSARIRVGGDGYVVSAAGTAASLRSQNGVDGVTRFVSVRYVGKA